MVFVKRKLVRQGKNALTVTVPSDWARKFGLKAGDEVNAEECENSIIINTEKAFSVSKASIDISDLDETLIWAYLIAAYRKGCDEIEVKFEKPEKIAVVQKVSDALLGMAVINQGKNFCLLKDLGGTGSTEFKTILRRIFILLSEMSKDSLEAVKNGNKEILRNMEYKDYSINKFSNFCLRLLSKGKTETAKDASLLHYVVAELENLGDEYTRLCLDLSETSSKANISDKALNLFADVNELFELYYRLFYKFENKTMAEMIEKKNHAGKQIKKILPARQDETIVIYHLSKIVQLIINLAERQILMNV